MKIWNKCLNFLSRWQNFEFSCLNSCLTFSYSNLTNYFSVKFFSQFCSDIIPRISKKLFEHGNRLYIMIGLNRSRPICGKWNKNFIVITNFVQFRIFLFCLEINKFLHFNPKPHVIYLNKNCFGFLFKNSRLSLRPNFQS